MLGGAEAQTQFPDPAADRNQVIGQRLCDVFGTRDTPRPGDTLASSLPPEARAISIRNPGFGFTYADGLTPKGVYIVAGLREGHPITMRGQTKGKTDPVIGWTSYGCAGMETSDPRRYPTRPDGSTGYAIAQNKENYLYQVIEGELRPNQHYLLQVEVYARDDFDSVEPDEILFDLLAGDGTPIQSVGVHRWVPAPDPESRFSVATISLVTGPEQPEGDLMIRVGLNTERKRVRVNFDNLRLWAVERE
ncbi:hypothetical protein [Algisphaera agarilytica]|uniref:hypothetical protein n=1 Tax=Algisphaera agarilytica TaxID=1385975 RepID=UPI001C882AFD|nr:hypothetical protein [Algisphaera agarilytica]